MSQTLKKSEPVTKKTKRKEAGERKGLGVILLPKGKKSSLYYTRRNWGRLGGGKKRG